MAAGWEGQAACRGLDPALFYPAKDQAEQARRARAVCAACPVLEACLAATLEDEKRLGPYDREGIRGGLNGRERYLRQHGAMKPRRRKKTPTRRRASASQKLATCGTVSAHDRHKRRGEPVDEACAAAKSSRYASRRVLAAEEHPECGTRSGYLWHIAHHEIPCEPCTRADLAVTWFIRQTARA
ncbi:WhiB family transcriptional regulator [Streptomyces sp. NPDC048521]|uniref:WhiB family transcriptional regulator n=1 Tax=Streptomyces sp. NPDC048521 TaxID=3365566 RepID=UPI00371D05D8